jgi:hypothetical protein
MSDENWNETLAKKEVNYILELEDRIIVVENVPARISLETGERYFAPETVERLQNMICESKKTPARKLLGNFPAFSLPPARKRVRLQNREMAVSRIHIIAKIGGESSELGGLAGKGYKTLARQQLGLLSALCFI